MSARGFIGAGDLYIARQVSGSYEDYAGPYECTKFEIKPNVDVKEQVSKGRSTYGQVIETVAVPKPFKFTINLAEVNKDALALALLGTTSALAQTAGSLTAVDVTANLDKWVQLSKQALTGSPTLTNAGATTTYVEGVDYIVNKQLGWIKCLSTGSITAAQPLKFTSAYGAISGIAIAGGTQAQVRAKFKLDGINFADQNPVIVTCHEGVIAADSAFDFLADNFNTVALPGSLKTPAGFTEPFNVHLRGV